MAKSWRLTGTSALSVFMLCTAWIQAGFAQEAEVHTKHVLYGSPLGTPATNDLVLRDIYVLSSNDSTKFADWVAYRIDSTTVTGTSPDRSYKADPWLEEDETLEPTDYDSAYDQLGTHRGHQAPLAAFRGTSDADATNYLSNITPQRGALNSGPWENLEQAVRELASEEMVYVLTGPLYEREAFELPLADEPHRVPSGYWKVVALPNDSVMDWAAFVMEQSLEGGADYCAQQVSINDVEARSGLNLFGALPDTMEEALESGPSRGRVASQLGC